MKEPAIITEEARAGKILWLRSDGEMIWADPLDVAALEEGVAAYRKTLARRLGL